MDRSGMRKRYLKLSLCAELREQIVCSLKVRRSPRHDTVDFIPVTGRASSSMPLSTVVADMGYDSEYNHRFVREHLDAVSIIPARFQDVAASDTPGKYRSMMKSGFDNKLYHQYHQRNKNETVMSVIKRMFGEYVRARNVKMQNRELIFRVIAYNMHRLSVSWIWFLQSQNKPDCLY
jgi:hypothetical protein